MYTNGPWEIIANKVCTIGKDKDRQIICIISDMNPFDPDSDNGLLIKSAPDLLDALESLVKEIDLKKLKIRKDFSLINAHAYANQIIRKAKGQ